MQPSLRNLKAVIHAILKVWFVWKWVSKIFLYFPVSQQDLKKQSKEGRKEQCFHFFCLWLGKTSMVYYFHEYKKLRSKHPTRSDGVTWSKEGLVFTWALSCIYIHVYIYRHLSMYFQTASVWYVISLSSSSDPAPRLYLAGVDAGMILLLLMPLHGLHRKDLGL